MTAPDISNLRFSSSSIDDFFSPTPVPKVASSGKIRVSSLHQLAGFHVVAEDQLVRVSQKEFWKLGQDTDGYFIERLVEDTDGPVVGT
jgi:hypothetical protein